MPQVLSLCGCLPDRGSVGSEYCPGDKRERRGAWNGEGEHEDVDVGDESGHDHRVAFRVFR